METRARYVLIGLFTLLVAAGAFLFVYWMENRGGMGPRAEYRVRFDGPVSGLMTGSGVLFNGIRAGEVTGIYLSARDPRMVEVAIAVDPQTPIRTDTRASVEYQGLTGIPVIFLTGGKPDAPAVQSVNGMPKVLIADPSSGVSVMQAGRQVLQRLDNVLSENSEAMHSTIANLNTFSDALSRNSERVDGIFAGLERMTGGGKKGHIRVYDLTALPAGTAPAASPAGLMTVPEPTALLALDSEKIQARPGADGKPALEGMQWADNLPKVLQGKLVQSFENAGFGQSVTRPVDGATPDYQLLVDIRAFQLMTEGEPAALVELGLKVVNGSGKIVASRVFKQSAPAKGLDAQSAAAALDQAFGKAQTEIVPWAVNAASQPVADKG